MGAPSAVVVVVASPGPGRRPGPARRPPGGAGAVAVIGEGDLDVGHGIEDVEDVVDEGVFVEEVLVVAGDLESPLRRSLLLNDFDPEGFGEIPWSDFLRALETPEFCQAVGPAKREILTAKAHRSHTSAITFDDFVAVLPSGRRLRVCIVGCSHFRCSRKTELLAVRPKSAQQQLTAAARIAKMDEVGSDPSANGAAVTAYPPMRAAPYPYLRKSYWKE
ncbi:hypothetical protein HPB52_019930 [Rhipicephalus sanguineus]|uniref:EF-hand domain-containing protein n=1 Tax=Rhipicephalus sanguineus TaxID=34632 RepID=A0A9D4PJQ7_RHISA|nr:hypothetical protein HPB52_019930 [Rhipicephalus sanguineus]